MKVPLQSRAGEVTLAELQTALELVPGSGVLCLAFMANKRVCDAILESSWRKRNQILGEIADEMTQNGSAIASDKLEELLDELACTLICAKKHCVRKRGKQCDQVEHVTELLRDRLEDFEETRQTRRKVEALVHFRRPARREDRRRASVQDESDGGSTANEGYSSNNSNDGELDDEPTSALALRPKAIPRHQATAKSSQCIPKSQMKTPNGTRQRPSGSGRRHRESDESDGSSPGTAASEVFSHVSSKWSATTAPSSRPSTSRRGLHWQRNETPTGHRHVRDTTDVDSNPDSEYVDQGGESDNSASSSASSQGTDHEAEESEAESAEDDESFPETIIAFELSKLKPRTADHVLNLMLSTIKKASPGYVYCFSDMDVKGFLKIGYAGIDEVQKLQPEAKVPITGRDTRSRLWKRLEEQQKRCKYNMKFEFDVYMPSAAHKMEKLIHATLRENNARVTCCRNSNCRTKHEEWFKVSLGEARYTMEAWQKFSRLKPWTANGALRKEWSSYARENLAQRTFAKLPVQTWFHDKWPEALVRAEKRRQKQASIKKLEMEVAQAQDIADEKQRLLYQAELHKAEKQWNTATWERDRAQEGLEEKKKKLLALKKRRTTVD